MLDLREAPQSACLSVDEMKVAALVGQGLWSGQIAAQLSMAEASVNERIADAMAKLGIEDRLDFRQYAKLLISGSDR